MIDIEIIKSAVDKIQSMNYGEDIPHSELAEMLGVAYKSSAYRAAMSKVQARCLEAGKMLESIHKIGYRITYADDYSEQALKQFRQGALKMSKGEKVLTFAPVNDMSQAGLIQHRNIMDKVLILNAHLSGAMVELKQLKKTHPLSLDGYRD